MPACSDIWDVSSYTHYDNKCDNTTFEVQGSQLKDQRLHFSLASIKRSCFAMIGGFQCNHYFGFLWSTDHDLFHFDLVDLVDASPNFTVNNCALPKKESSFAYDFVKVKSRLC